MVGEGAGVAGNFFSVPASEERLRDAEVLSGAKGMVPSACATLQYTPAPMHQLSPEPGRHARRGLGLATLRYSSAEPPRMVALHTSLQRPITTLIKSLCAFPCNICGFSKLHSLKEGMSPAMVSAGPRTLAQFLGHEKHG